MTVVCKIVANKSSDCKAVENRPELCVAGLCLSSLDKKNQNKTKNVYYSHTSETCNEATATVDRPPREIHSGVGWQEQR